MQVFPAAIQYKQIGREGSFILSGEPLAIALPSSLSIELSIGASIGFYNCLGSILVIFHTDSLFP